MEKNQKRNEIMLIIISLIPIVFFIFSWNDLPDPMPTHFNINMEPDDYSSRTSALIFITGTMVAMFLLFKYIPRIDPKGKIKMHSKVYVIIRFIMAILMAFIAVLFIINAQMKVSEQLISGGVCISLGAVFIGLGNYLPVIKQNFFVGIRTPWTLSSEAVWTKTHRVGGKLMVIGGVLMLGAAFIPNIVGGVIASVIVLVAMMLGLVIYSFVLFKKEKKSEKL